MKATVTKTFDGLPDGEHKVKSFGPGDPVTGDLAVVAVREGWATPDTDEEVEAPPPAPAAPKAAKRGKATKADGEGQGEGEGV